MREGGGFITQRKAKEKMTIQKDLTQFDERLRKHCEQADGRPFDREGRLAMLENQQCNPVSNSIIGTLFQELKNKERHEKTKRSWFSIT